MFWFPMPEILCHGLPVVLTLPLIARQAGLGDDMDQLVLAAASALIGAMTTDGWNEARASAVALWRRAHPDRVPAIESELSEVRDEILAAREAGEPEVERDLVADWQRKFRRLITAHPELAAELEVLQDEWSRLHPASAAGQHIEQITIVSGNGTAYVAGRDQHMTGR